MNQDRKLYDPAAEPKGPRFQWVELDRGWVCVHEMALADTMQITERSVRPGLEPSSGLVKSAAVVYQIMYSCRRDEAPDSPRVFSDVDFTPIQELRFHEFDALLQAINEVSGKSATEEERLRDFTQATGQTSTP